MSFIFPNIPRFVHRNGVVLPAGGAVTTLADGSYASGSQWNTSNGPLNGAFFVPDGIYHVSFWLTYTRAPGQAGAVAVGMMQSNGTETARAPVPDGAIAVGGGYGQQGVYAWDLAPLPVPGTDAPVTYQALPFDCYPGWWVWLQLREVGATATPGTALVAVTASH